MMKLKNCLGMNQGHRKGKEEKEARDKMENQIKSNLMKTHSKKKKSF